MSKYDTHGKKLFRKRNRLVAASQQAGNLLAGFETPPLKQGDQVEINRARRRAEMSARTRRTKQWIHARRYAEHE